MCCVEMCAYDVVESMRLNVAQRMYQLCKETGMRLACDVVDVILCDVVWCVALWCWFCCLGRSIIGGVFEWSRHGCGVSGVSLMYVPLCV